MGIVFAASADIRDLSVWSATSGTLSISNTVARTGTYSYKLTDSAVYQAAVPGRVDYYAKVAVYLPVPVETQYIRFREEAITHVTLQLSTSAGTIKVWRGDAVALLGTSSGFVLSTNQWHCIEAYVKIDNSTGVVTIKVNGTQVLALTGVDTQNAGTSIIDNLRCYAQFSNSFYIDDIVIRDDAWPGTGGLYLLTADGDGSDTGWTASTGNRWDCVDEVPPSATDYISTAGGTPNTKNTFTFANLGITPDSIASVSVLAKAKLAAAGVGNIRAIAKSGSTYGNGASTALGVTETWAALHTTVDPNTSSAWDLTGVNALSAGVETV